MNQRKRNVGASSVVSIRERPAPPKPGVLARVFEEQGLVTTSISLVREHTEKVKPPRALFVPFPFGHPLGEANDPELQTRVMRAAFALLDESSGPALVDYPEDVYSDQEINLPQA